jgi:hypothetical protein
MGLAFTSFGKKISNRGVVVLGAFFFLLAACAGRENKAMSARARRRLFKRGSLGEGQFITRADDTSLAFDFMSQLSAISFQLSAENLLASA